jgi:hypothetical protein
MNSLDLQDLWCLFSILAREPALRWVWNEKPHGEAGARRSGDGLEQDAPATDTAAKFLGSINIRAALSVDSEVTYLCNTLASTLTERRYKHLIGSKNCQLTREDYH